MKSILHERLARFTFKYFEGNKKTQMQISQHVISTHTNNAFIIHSDRSGTEISRKMGLRQFANSLAYLMIFGKNPKPSF